jgi:para-aminobenzoate synthetase component 1
MAPPAMVTRIGDRSELKHRLLHWARLHDPVVILNSNGHTGDIYSRHDLLAAVGQTETWRGQAGHAFDALRDFVSAPSWVFGFLTYDLKNEIERLESNHFDGIGIPAMCFFRPEAVIAVRGTEVEVWGEEPKALLEQVMSIAPPPHKPSQGGGARYQIHQRFAKEGYASTVERIREHIAAGDVYEMNLCQEFFAEGVGLDPLDTFIRLNDIAKTPFAAFVRTGGKYLMCASPERFLAKRGNQLISQPIKGTIRRSADPQEDERLKEQLRHDPKERAENVMITDLVRNDLAKSARPGTVKVEELCGVHTFEGVHQLITTVTAELEAGVDAVTAIRNAFPMGSMTGAPKVAAMELIEKYEKTKRGLYSGSVGYFAPNGDFDFNVVIRSMLYNAESKYLSFQTGGAITYDSEAEKEWEECLLKAENVIRALDES